MIGAGSRRVLTGIHIEPDAGCRCPMGSQRACEAAERIENSYIAVADEKVSQLRHPDIYRLHISLYGRPSQIEAPHDYQGTMLKA